MKVTPRAQQRIKQIFAHSGAVDVQFTAVGNTYYAHLITGPQQTDIIINAFRVDLRNETLDRVFDIEDDHFVVRDRH